MLPRSRRPDSKSNCGAVPDCGAAPERSSCVRGELLLLKALGLPPAALNVIALEAGCRELRARYPSLCVDALGERSSWCCELGCVRSALQLRRVSAIDRELCDRRQTGQCWVGVATAGRCFRQGVLLGEMLNRKTESRGKVGAVG
jgi:hypothetical protein